MDYLDYLHKKNEKVRMATIGGVVIATILTIIFVLTIQNYTAEAKGFYTLSEITCENDIYLEYDDTEMTGANVRNLIEKIYSNKSPIGIYVDTGKAISIYGENDLHQFRRDMRKKNDTFIVPTDIYICNIEQNDYSIFGIDFKIIKDEKGYN